MAPIQPQITPSSRMPRFENARTGARRVEIGCDSGTNRGVAGHAEARKDAAAAGV